MYQRMFDLKDRMQEAMHNPSLALRNGLARLPDQIRQLEEQLDQLREQLAKFEQEGGERERENRRGFFGQKKEPGLWASIGEGINKWATSGTKSSIAQTEAELKHVESLYDELRIPLYPKDKQWMFDEVDREINKLYNQLAGAHSTIENAGNSAMMAMNTQPKVQKDQDNPWAPLVGDLQKMGAASMAMEGMDEVLLRMCKLTLELENLYATRRNLLPTFLNEVEKWDKARITVEMQRRNRDLQELPSESEVLSRQLSNLPANTMSPEMIKHSPVYAAFGEQRRFLQDVIFELEAAMKRNKDAPKASDPTEDKIKELKDLKRRRDEVLANETDPEIRDAIKRAYGKKIDALSEQL